MPKKISNAAYHQVVSMPWIREFPGKLVIVVAMPLLFGSCSPATTYFRHGGNMAAAVSSFASPKVGIAVVVFDPSKGGEDLTALRDEISKALALQFQSKGYLPTHLHSLTVPGSLSRYSFDGTRPHRTHLQGPVFEAAQQQGLSGAFVMWVEVTRRDPRFEISDGFTKKFGEGPKGWFSVVTRTEIYSSAGEPLCVGDAPGVEGMDSLQVSKDEKGGTYRLLSETEIASKAVSNALYFLPARKGK